MEQNTLSFHLNVKGTVSRNILPSVFFHQTIPPGPLIHGLKPFWILLRIRRDMIDFQTQKSCMRCQWHRMHKKNRIYTRIRIRDGIRYTREQCSPDHPAVKSAQNLPEWILWASPRPTGASLAGVPAPQEHTGGHPRPAGRRCQRSIHMLSSTYEDDIKIKNKHVAGISTTFYLSIETISRPSESRETIPLNLVTKMRPKKLWQRNRNFWDFWLFKKIVFLPKRYEIHFVIMTNWHFLNEPKITNFFIPILYNFVLRRENYKIYSIVAYLLFLQYCTLS
jgi:hypothetical protein